MIIGPCKDCEKRYLGCHSKCENYKKYKEEKEKENKIISKSKYVYYTNYELNRKRFSKFDR